MKKFLTITLALAMLLGMVNTAMAATFTDVPANHWAYNAVEGMAAKGIVNGVGDGKFAPNDKVSGAEFTAMLTRTFYGEQVLTEAKNNGGADWSAPYLAAAKEQKLLENVIANNNAMNRTNMAGMIYNFLNEKKVELPTDEELSKVAIPDIGSLTDEQQKRITVVYALGYLKGVDDEGNFKGADNMTRAEAATVLTRLMEKYPSDIKVKADDVEEARKDKMGIEDKPVTSTPSTGNEELTGEYWKNDEFEIYAISGSQENLTEIVRTKDHATNPTQTFAAPQFTRAEVLVIKDKNGYMKEHHYLDDGEPNYDFSIPDVNAYIANNYKFYSSNEQIVQVDKYGRWDVTFRATLDGPEEVSAYITVVNKNGKSAKVKVTAKSALAGQTWYSFDDDYFDAYVAEMLRLVNEARADEGLNPLTLDNGMVNLAKKRTVELESDYSHDTNLFPVGAYGENIGSKGAIRQLDGRVQTSPERYAAIAFESWMNSEGHRNNILKPSYKRFGTAFSINGRGYVVQLFTSRD